MRVTRSAREMCTRSKAHGFGQPCALREATDSVGDELRMNAVFVALYCTQVPERTDFLC